MLQFVEQIIWSNSGPAVKGEGFVRHRTAVFHFTVFFLFASVTAARGQQGALDGLLERDLPALVSTYQTLHATPELSHHEAKTSALVARELRALGYTVTEGTIRTYKEEVRQRILAALERMAQGIAFTDGIPAARAPMVTTSDSEYTPSTYNDPQLTLRLAQVFKKVLGPENVEETPAVMASEDFCRFGLENHQIPICQFALGAVDAAKLDESRRTGVPLPGLHSSLWAPIPEPTLRSGVKSMTSAVLELMKKQDAQACGVVFSGVDSSWAASAGGKDLSAASTLS
jgi:metal-dependent amidase/aminoacylase/carboxypeptidase family protein